ncbi:MAG: beta-galactosidase GalA [Planctomycetota bacterium]
MREIFDMNPGWRFHRGDIAFRNHGGIHVAHFDAAEWMKAGNHGVAKPDYPDESWEPVDLPHDFVLDGTFTPEANLTHGSLPTDVGWYRKTFELPEGDRGRRLWLAFDGVYRDAQVWVNGHLAGRHLSGYTSFGFVISDVCHFGGLNTIAVRADAREYELWSYEGGGIYRDVRMIKTHATRLAENGTHVQVEPFSGPQPEAVNLELSSRIVNDTDETCSVRVSYQVMSQEPGVCASSDQGIAVDAWGQAESRAELVVLAPRLWSVEDPYLYTLVTTIRQDGEIIDQTETPFGIRSVRFDAKTGFYLNDRPLKLKGVCNHQDHAGVGVAVPRSLDAWRVQQVKKMGANAIRTSHNPPSPAMLDACDRLGVLVLDEHRQVGTSTEHLDQLESLVRRDRNHPCVFAWSLGNEEMNVQHTDVGVRQLQRMQALCHRLDPTRPVTYAMNCKWLDNAEVHHQHGFHLDVYGTNYVCREHCNVDGGMYDDFHARYPDWPLLATETGGSASYRGVYRPEDAHPGLNFEDSAWWTNPDRKGLVSAYGETCTPWGYSVEQTWIDCHDRPFVAGTFLWTGFDYRGETYPTKYPAVITGYGLMDLCGFPKDAFHYYRVHWNDEPAIHLFPHWNWAGAEGETIDVRCYANCDAVELLLNGESLGRQPMPPRRHVTWQVPYNPGTLEAVGYDAKGAVVASKTIETTGPVSSLRLTPDRTEPMADGNDTVAISVAATDAAGRFVATADDAIHFEVEGPAQLLGVGNGNPWSHEPDRAPSRRLYQGLCQLLVRTQHAAGEIHIKATGPGLEPATLTVHSQPAPDHRWIGAAVQGNQTAQPTVDTGTPIDNAL